MILFMTIIVILCGETFENNCWWRILHCVAKVEARDSRVTSQQNYEISGYLLFRYFFYNYNF